MRISRIRIGSFGGVKDRDYRLSDGMTVFHGPNESGKTSTMDFIRHILVPSNKKKGVYPVRSKTDNGTLELEEGGRSLVLELSAKSVSGERPSCLDNMDPELFRSVFAMGPEGLDDSEVVTRGDIKSRFLTIPGGAGIPAARDWSEGEEKEKLGLRSTSSSQLNALDGEIKALKREIAEKRSEADRYGALSEELAKITEERERLSAESVRSSQEADIYRRYQDNSSNFSNLESLRAERCGIGEFIPVTAEDERRFTELESKFNEENGKLEYVETRIADLREDLGGVDARKVLSSGRRIDELPGRLATYQREKSELSAIPESVHKSKANRKLAVLGAVLIVAGVALALVEPLAAVLAVGGVAVLLIGLRGKSSAGGAASVRKEDLTRSTRAFEDDLHSICSDLGVVASGPSDAVEKLCRLRTTASSISSTESELMRAKMSKLEAQNRFMGFIGRYGGKDGFERCRESTSNASSLDLRISQLEEAIRSSGLDPDSPVCPVSPTVDGSRTRVRELDVRMGEVRASMKHILDMDDLERSIDRLTEKESALREVLMDGAVAVIAKRIVQDACDEAYGSVQPGVMATADRYLGMMTCGLYSLGVEPETGDIVAKCDGMTKAEDRWSSGLRAQVLLSLKLAVARELGSGEIPVMLDDVLLPFDSDRKRGAVTALQSISSEMQILMFTCDSETVRLSKDAGITTVPMR